MYKSQSARRTVFADANRANLDSHQPTAPFPGVAKLPTSPPRKPQETATKQASPPLPRQNSKAVPPSPPNIIRDMNKQLMFTRLGLLGEGGFARVYEVKDMRGARQAIKVVTKASLKTKKAKTKLYAEIKIHKSLRHPNIVQFNECFEDLDNVYMTLELCESGSVMDMLRRRRRFSEAEARYFMVQIIGACNYMHNNQIIHRDLKLGNLFLDSNMNIKVGDFGLAALIENPGERKKTICGTPNYIAPEILFDTANGHSFEVDTWSIGVILYTLVIGKPPFQTKEVKTIYKRIRDNQYEWPADREVSFEARELVTQILLPNPQERPALIDILEHKFFICGTFPPNIPITAKDAIPDFRGISSAVSLSNFNKIRRNALLDVDQSIAMADASTHTRSAMSISIADQEREFQKAVQPGSPISALLSSARQPLIVGPNRGEVPLIRKLQQVSSKERALPTIPSSRTALTNIEEVEEDPKRREIESQKARIVAQMVPVGSAPSSASPLSAGFPPTFSSAVNSVKEVVDENVPPSIGSTLTTKSRMPSTLSLGKKSSTATLRTNLANIKGYDAFIHTLDLAFQAKTEGKLFRDPSRDIGLPHARVFIVSWVDYCNKYGMGYALTDGTVGVSFNDTTSILLSPDKANADYVPTRAQRFSYEIGSYPPELKTKIYLLKHFESYMMEKLYGEYDYVYQDSERTKGMDYVETYHRLKNVIVFKLSHGVMQFNFVDHSKLILSSQGLHVTHIDKNYNLTRWALSDVMRRALLPPPEDPDAAKIQKRLVDKLRYAKEVLHGLRALQDPKDTEEAPER